MTALGGGNDRHKKGAEEERSFTSGRHREARHIMRGGSLCVEERFTFDVAKRERERDGRESKRGGGSAMGIWEE